MKKETFERKDGTTGEKYTLEDGDKFISRYDAPKKAEFGQYENWSLGITTVPDNEDIFIQVTKGQAKRMLGMGNLQGKKIECYKYKNKYGEYIGLRFA